MRGLLQLSSLLSTLLTGTAASGLSHEPVVENRASKGPIPPSQDPFYTAPKGWQREAPGTVLRIREDPSNITAVVNAAAAYNVVFRTTNSLYEPSWAVTTVLEPREPARSGCSNGCLLSYQIAYNTADVDASPSYLLSTEYAASQGGIPGSTDDIKPALSHGWFVNVPDFEGPLAAFASGVLEGHAVLDSIRATSSIKKFFRRPEAVKSAMWGYSGGSIASEFAAELQSEYASELNLVGAAIGGVVDNATQTFANITGSAYAGLLPLGLLGLTVQYPTAREYLLSQLKTEGPFNKTVFLTAEHMTFTEAFGTFAMQDIFEYFTSGRDILTSTELIRVIGNNAFMGFHGIPQIPVFAYKAIGDQLTSIVGTDSLIDRYCRAGADVWYQRNTVGDHITEIANGAPKVLEWLQSVFDGTYQQTSGCKIEDVTVNVTEST